jgi:hypothetical protein
MISGDSPGIISGKMLRQVADDLCFILCEDRTLTRMVAKKYFVETYNG